MTTFNKLNFKPHPVMDGVAAKIFFGNGYGASVVRFIGSYGSEDDLFELAVLVGTKKKWGLSYDTPITDDVEGHLSEDEVTTLLGKIEALPTPVIQAAE